MPLLLNCAKCGQPVSVPDDRAGALVTCPKCNAPLTVPPPLPSQKDDPDDRVHPVVWASVGGGVVAVVVLVVALIATREHRKTPSASPPPESALVTPADDRPKRDKPSEREDRAVADEHRDLVKRLGDGQPEAAKSKLDASLQELLPKVPPTVQPNGAKPESPAKQPAAKPLTAEQLYKTASPAVVTIAIENDHGDEIASGSGFFVPSELVRGKMWWDKYPTVEKQPAVAVSRWGCLVTNYHVIQSAVDAKVTFAKGVTGYVTEVIAEDKDTDLAILLVFVNPAGQIPALSLADDSPEVGATVYAIGNPRSLTNSLSQGIVSSFREIRGARWIQTTAPISSGSSGGPLLSLEGKVVGITTASLTEGQNLNFAVPVSEVRRILSQPARTRELWKGVSYHEEETWAYKDLQYDSASRSALASLRKAREHRLAKRYREAIDTANEARASIPRELEYLAHYTLADAHSGIAHERLGNIARQEKPGSDFKRAMLNDDSFNTALKEYESTVALKPDFAPAHSGLFHLHYLVDHFPEALVAADALVKLVPRCAEAYRYRGKAYRALDRPLPAIRDFKVSIELDPKGYPFTEFWIDVGGFG